MSIPNRNQTAVGSEQQLFIQKALATVEKAERFQRIKQIVATVLAFTAAFWLAFRSAGAGLDATAAIIVLCLGLAVCTAKILSLINKNTKVLLQAIADLHQSREFH